ncbi:MAG: AAA family ATPase [Clostridia bacterium]|nr:AAA family ATPase [Clostridia bacterium]
MAIIYGKNGSGKSTISRAFSSIKDVNSTTTISAELIDINKVRINTKPEQLVNIFVFNEDYVLRKIRLQDDGLGTIIMFGEQVDLDDKISKAQTEYDNAIYKYDQQDALCQNYDNYLSPSSPMYHMDHMISLLRGNDSWAKRDRQIKGNQINSSVNEEVVIDIATHTSKRSKEDVKSDFDQKMKVFEKISGGVTKLESAVEINDENIDEENIIRILAERVERPILSDRDNYILEQVVNGRQEFFEDVKDQFSKSDVSICPFCLQSISTEYRKGLINSIQKVLNDAVEVHKNKIENAKLSLIDFDSNQYNVLDGSTLGLCITVISEANEIIKKYNGLLEKKLTNVYLPIEVDKFGLTTKLQDVHSALILLEMLRIDYNKSIEQKEALRINLLLLNKELAYFDLQEPYKQYSLLRTRHDSEKELLKSLEVSKNEHKRNLDDLNQQKKSVKIASKYINMWLHYVFFSKNRLEVYPDGNAYKLLSHGKPVKPADVSCGERNILALCYYFTEMMDNLHETDMYSKECLLIIDDPISSFDLEIRIGILSFIKMQLLRILCGNMMSKVVVFSHDLTSVLDLEKIFKEIKTEAEAKYGKNTSNHLLLELRDKSLQNFPGKSRNEYSLLLICVYNFASGSSPNDELIIGNVMRRALEAFSTFEYKKGIEEVSCDSNILATMQNPIYIDYFKNLMYRLVLNDESHLFDRTRYLQDPNFFSTTTKEEKIRTAKDILCFISLLNEKHLESHLGVTSMGIIRGWCNDIQTKHSI